MIAAEQILLVALADAGVAADDETVTTAPVEGHAAEVLMKKAEDAEPSTHLTSRRSRLDADGNAE